MMPKLPDLPFVEGSPDGDLPPSAVRAWAISYARAVAEACADRCRTVIYEGSNTAEECEDAIREAAKELK